MWGGRGRVVMAAVVAALLLPACASATIIYRHGGDVWAMNDDGSGAHALVTITQIPAPGPWTIGDPDVLPNGNTIVFTGTTGAYDNHGSTGPAGACGINCSGTFKLQNGAITRLSPTAAPCGTAQWCTSFQTQPRLTADGLVAFDTFIATWAYQCSGFICNWGFTDSSHSLDTFAASDGSGFTEWKHSPTTSEGLAIDPLPAPDPANPGLLAYAEETNCSGGCHWRVHVGSRDAATDTTVVEDDAPFVSLAWKPDGTKLIDVEAGTQAGIWAYDGSDATNPAKLYTWVLADPQPYDSTNPYSTSIDQARFIGSDSIVFSQKGDLYTIPFSACLGKGSGSTAGCTMADAHRLTTTGDNQEPVWTSAAFITPNPNPNPNPNPTPKPTTHCVVPKLGGLTVSGATTTLNKAHCALGKQTKAYSSRVKKGRVISQSKRSGTTLAAGSHVAITVSKGKKPRPRRRH